MKTEIEKRASKFIDETDMMQFSTMEIMVMFAEIELRAFKKQLNLSGVSQLRETLLAYEIYNASEDDKKNNMTYLENLVDTYLANNCG